MVLFRTLELFWRECCQDPGVLPVNKLCNCEIRYEAKGIFLRERLIWEVIDIIGASNSLVETDWLVVNFYDFLVDSTWF